MKKSFLFFVPMLAMVFGIGAALNINGGANDAHEVAAANTGAAGDTIFFTPSNHWAEANATFKLQWYKSGTYLGSAFMETASASVGAMSSRTTYYAKPNVAFDAVQVLRFNPQKSTQWNYSNNSSVSGTNRWLKMDANCNWDNTWSAGDASGTIWQNVDINILRSQQSASNNSTRLFIYNSGSHFNPVAIRATGGSAAQSVGGTTADASIYHPTWFEDVNGTWYGYCDVPTNITNFKIINCGTENSYDAYANYFSNNEFTLASNANCVFYCPKDGNLISTGGARDNVAGPALMAKVIEAVNTCSSNSYNGYGSYTNLNNYYYSHATSAAKSSSCKSLGGSKNYTVDQHFAELASHSSNANSRIISVFGSNSSTTSIMIVTIVTLVSVTAIGGYYFVHKRKEH